MHTITLNLVSKSEQFWLKFDFVMTVLVKQVYFVIIKIFCIEITIKCVNYLTLLSFHNAPWHPGGVITPIYKWQSSKEPHCERALCGVTLIISLY